MFWVLTLNFFCRYIMEYVQQNHGNYKQIYNYLRNIFPRYRISYRFFYKTNIASEHKNISKFICHLITLLLIQFLKFKSILWGYENSKYVLLKTNSIGLCGRNICNEDDNKCRHQNSKLSIVSSIIKGPPNYNNSCSRAFPYYDSNDLFH